MADFVSGEVINNSYEKLSGAGHDEIANKVANQTPEQKRSLDGTYHALAANRLAVEKLATSLY